MSFDTRFLTIGELFGGQNSFICPPFQRPYSWRPEMASELCEDLQEASVRWAGGEGRAFESEDPYFLGTLIVARRPGNSPFSVIDGQQRLVTLTAILAILRDRISDPSLRLDIQGFIERPEQLAIGLPRSERVKPRDIDQTDYRNWVVEQDGTTHLPNRANGEHSLFLDALKAIDRSLENAQESYYRTLAEFILKRCSVVLIDAGTVAAAFRLFKSVNRPGQPLSEIDFARTEYIGVSDDVGAEGVQLAAAWDAVESDLSEKEFQKYIEIVATKTVGSHRATSLASTLQNISRSPQLSIAFRSNLYSFLQSFKALEHYNLDFGGDSAAVNNALISLSNWDNEGWKNIAIDWLITRPSSANTIKLFRGLEALCIYFVINAVPKRQQTIRFKNIHAAIEDPNLFNSASSPLYLNRDELSKTLDKLTQPIRNTKIIKPLLSKLNTMMGASPFEKEYLDTLTVEHVLPQKPAKNSNWAALFQDATARKRYTLLLGNHALLTRSANPRGSNKDFWDKKKAYFSFEGHQSFPITTQIAIYEDWTPDVIEGRTEDMRKMIRTALEAL